MGASIGIGASLLGAGSALSGLFGGTPAQNVQLPPQFTMPNMGDAANSAYDLSNTIGSMPNIPQQLYPQFQQAAGNILNNPGQQQMIGGAQGAAALGAGAATQQYGLGNFLEGVGTSMMPYANAIMQQGFDPQNALYARTQQQLQEQVGASNAAAGLGTSPFGAGLTNQAMSNFNIDWQNNQLSRETTAAQGAAGLVAGGQGAISTGASMMAAAPGQLQQTSMAPYTAYNQIGGDQFNALNTLSGAGLQMLTTPQAQQQAYLNYLQTGNQSGQVANQQAQVALNQANLGFNQSQTLGNQLGTSLAMLGNNLGGNNNYYGSTGGNQNSAAGTLGWG